MYPPRSQPLRRVGRRFQQGPHSWSQVARLFAEVDHPWLSTRVTNARLTAAGLVHALRDQQPPTDRRLLALSEEFASILYALKRGKAQLSPLLRSAWDSGNLPTLDMLQHLQATGTHIGLIAHVTQRELAQSLHYTEAHDGFPNRCLWTWVQRNNCLPEGGNLSAGAVSAVARELRRTLDWAASTPEILFRRDDAASELWRDCYPALSQLRPACPACPGLPWSKPWGLCGAATSRAEAQVLRLSAIYAPLDGTRTTDGHRRRRLPQAAPLPSGRPPPGKSRRKSMQTTSWPKRRGLKALMALLAHINFGLKALRAL